MAKGIKAFGVLFLENNGRIRWLSMHNLKKLCGIARAGGVNAPRAELERLVRGTSLPDDRIGGGGIGNWARACSRVGATSSKRMIALVHPLLARGRGVSLTKRT
jgi:hypothetical protein